MNSLDRWLMVIVAASVVATPGCKKKMDFGASMEAARQQAKADDVEAAIVQYRKALDEPAFAADRGNIFRELLAMLVAKQRPDLARQAYLADAPLDPALAAAGLGIVANYYAGKGEWATLSAWLEQLRALHLADNLGVQVHRMAIDVDLRLDRPDAALALVPEIMEQTAPDGARRLLTFMRRAFLQREDVASARALQAAIAEWAGEDADWILFWNEGEISILVHEKDWPRVEDAFHALSGSAPDAVCNGAFGEIVAALSSAGESERLDALCAETMALDKLPQTRANAARRWIGLSRAGGDADAILDRLARIQGLELDEQTTFGSFRDVFYDVLGAADARRAQRLVDLGRALNARFPESPLCDSIQSLLFDAAFVAEDYDAVLETLDAGIEGREPQWIEMARIKVLAHKALKEGNLTEAAARFQTFTRYVDESWTEAEVDPSTGLRHSREMALGFNVRRIGDILKQAGDDEGAASAYAEARAYYQQASETVAPESAEAAHIQEALATLPQ